MDEDEQKMVTDEASVNLPEEQTINFKLDLHVPLLYLNPFKTTDTFEFAFGVTKETSVKLLLRNAQEGDRDFKYPDGTCIATCERVIPAQIREMLGLLAERHLPSGCKTDKIGPAYFTEDGRISEKQILPLMVFPEEYQRFALGLYDGLMDYAERTLRVMKWVSNTPGSPIICKPIGFFYSLDATNWHHVFNTNPPYGTGSAIMSDPASYQAAVQKCVEQGGTEPIGHNLWREAWNLRVDNPRASIILAIAAAEAGIKQHISKHVAHSEWLMENIPSPSIDTLIAKYLPSLPQSKLHLDKELRKRIADGVTARNKLAHLGKISKADYPKPYELLKDLRMRTELILAVQQLLYILDYNDGNAWAEMYIWNAASIKAMLNLKG